MPGHHYISAAATSETQSLILLVFLKQDFYRLNKYVKYVQDYIQPIRRESSEALASEEMTFGCSFALQIVSTNDQQSGFKMVNLKSTGD